MEEYQGDFGFLDEYKAKMIQKIEELRLDLSDSEWADEFFGKSIKDQNFYFSLSFLRIFFHFWVMYEKIGGY